jgi:hypothetical protein
VLGKGCGSEFRVNRLNSNACPFASFALVIASRPHVGGKSDAEHCLTEVEQKAGLAERKGKFVGIALGSIFINTDVKIRIGYSPKNLTLLLI